MSGDVVVLPAVESVSVTSNGLPYVCRGPGGCPRCPGRSVFGGTPVVTGMKKGSLLGVQAGEPRVSSFDGDEDAVAYIPRLALTACHHHSVREDTEMRDMQNSLAPDAMRGATIPLGRITP